jgi:hypothetical protein
VTCIALAICFDLLTPKRNPRFWQFCVSTVRMSMPKATMYEYHSASTSENKIRLTRQRRIVQTISIPQPEHYSTDSQFRRRID